MAEYGIIKTGFNRKRLDVIKSELETDFKSVFGANLNVSAESPHGQIIGLLSGSFADLWEICENIYNARNPNKTSQSQLDDLLALNNLTRLSASSSLVSISVTGDNGIIIPAGSLISTSDSNAQFSIDSDITIVAGVGSGSATSVDVGEIKALSGTLTKIDTPITGWASVTNATDATLGREIETDPEARARRIASVGLDSLAFVDSIYAQVASVTGVTKTRVLENDTAITDGDGLPPHSVSVIVEGGSDADVARAVFIKNYLGTTFGNTLVVVTDSQNINHNIYITRPTVIPIYVVVDLTVNSEYPVDGDDQIKQAIVDYANGDLIAGRDFGLGEDVIYSRLYTPINTVAGHEIDALKIGTSPAPTGTINIPIAIDEVSQFVIANITVNS